MVAISDLQAIQSPIPRRSSLHSEILDGCLLALRVLDDPASLRLLLRDSQPPVEKSPGVDSIAAVWGFGHYRSLLDGLL